MPGRGGARLALHETIRLSDTAGLSSYHLQRALRASRGVSPKVFVAHRRVERAKALAPARMGTDCVHCPRLRLQQPEPPNSCFQSHNGTDAGRLPGASVTNQDGVRVRFPVRQPLAADPDVRFVDAHQAAFLLAEGALPALDRRRLVEHPSIDGG